ncbi:MAG: YebC/PmpR family DNA-binding transcriptional regulator [Xanthomonadales bacterium]|nr:YebC/PmpR family DNA-binding transcriptional regulator [Xanthomonadales bacterium]
MAGHSKWANIQHRKGKQDAARGKIFTKLVREIHVATRTGGADADGNPRLRLAIDKAVAASMPKDNIERAIKKASGDLEGVSYEELRYEGYAPGGVAVIVDCMTDNKNRTVADVRHAFSKFGGNLGTDGSVAYQFQKLGVLSFAPGVDEEKVMEVALEAGAEDVRSFDEDNSVEVITTPEDFDAVCAAMEAAGLKPDDAEVTMRAENDISLEGEQAQTVAKFLDWLEEMDDVQNVYSNADLGADAYD